MDSSWKNTRHIFFFELSPLVKLRPFEKIEIKFCKCHISKSIMARNLCQLIGDDERSLLIFFELLPFFDILDIANALSQKVLMLEARNFYFLIEYNE